MSGGATGADAGTLTLMIGGDKAAFERSAPCSTRLPIGCYILAAAALAIR
jgi:6-phosphogluconate dehydrogenase (decarboxylating)